MTASVSIVLFLICASRIANSQVTVPFTAEGTFTGCWSLTGALDNNVYIEVFNPPMAGGAAPPDPASTLFLALPPDPTPDIVSQNPNSLLIQMADVAQLSRAQLCNGLSATPFPGTLFTPQVGQQRFAGFYGAHIKISGNQPLLPECVPPGLPGVPCDPSKAPVTVTSIDVIIDENLVSGYLTPVPPGGPAIFKISNVPCAPVTYNSPQLIPHVVSITPKVVDVYGFEVDPKTLPVQAGTLASGWFSRINGENIFYYYLASVLMGTRLPGQYIAVSTARCVQQTSISIIGGISTSDATIPWPNPLDLGSIAVIDPQTNINIATVLPKNEFEAVPTGSFRVIIPVSNCPRSITVAWKIPVGLNLPQNAISMTLPLNIRKF